MSQEFMYVIYIRTTPERAWEALTSPEFTRRYWSGIAMVSSFVPGEEWALMIPDGRVADRGRIVRRTGRSAW